VSEYDLGCAVERVADSLTPEERLEELMDAYEQPLYAFLVAVVGDPDRAADCAQDTFVRAYQQLCRRRAVNRTWLFTVARNRAVDEFRQQQRESRKVEHLTRHADGASTTQFLDPHVQRVLFELSQDDREILYLWAVDTWSGKEIGEVLNIRPEAVHMRLSRARRRFRAAYGDGP
jgi:RNA polymerase sigma-70 factor, ECF subfamily